MSGVKKTLTRALLIGLYVAAVWSRLGDGSGPAYQYFTGASATHFRHAQMVAESGSPPVLDRKTDWPDGYRPADVHAMGVEYFVGYAYRLAALFSDVSPRNFAVLLTTLFASLSAFTIFLLAWRWWGCMAGALLAAGLFVFAAPVITATNGREFLHGPYAIVLVSLHLALLLGFRRRATGVTTALAAVVFLALLAVWEDAGLYLTFFVAVMLLLPGLERAGRARFLLAHAGAVVLGVLVLPHLRAQRFLVSWPVLFTAAATAYTVLGPRLPRRVPGFVYVLGGFVVLAAALRSLQDGQMLSGLSYAWARIRFALDKPEDPALLSPAARYMWTHARTFPQKYTLLQFFLPLVFLVPAMVAGLRQLRRDKRAPVVLPVLLAVSGVAAFLVDRTAVLFAALGVMPLLGAGMYDFRRHLKTRALPLGVALVLVATQVLYPFGRANATYDAGQWLGWAHENDGFLWVSLGNTDRELLGFVVSRTSTRDVILAPEETSSFVTTFTGRTSVLVPGMRTRKMMQQTMDATTAMFAPEPQLYALCRDLGVQYVLYRIDYVLDVSKYGPAYEVGLRRLDENSVAVRMHFAPQTLDHFALVYENDHYRLFKVANEPQPVFLTDHPLVYQHSILERNRDTLESFYARVVDLLLTYTTGLKAQVDGNEDQAISRFRYCLQQAPYFTKAWLGVGDSLLRKGDNEAANAAYNNVLVYAPDNPHALYYSAVALARMDRRSEALGLLEVLLSSTGDREFLVRAKELKASLERRTQAPDAGGGSEDF